jgi:hypothetical protein
MRPTHRGHRLRLLSAATSAALLMLVSSGAATPDTWRVEVSVTPGQSGETDASTFEQIVLSEVSRLDIDEAHCPSSCVLSATLVKLKTQSSGNLVTASCSVSATVRERSSGSIRAVLRGRARAKDGKVRAKRTREVVMEAAVHSALSRLESPRP